MEEDHQARIRGCWNALGVSETDGTKLSPLEKDCGGPMLRLEWRGIYWTETQHASKRDHSQVNKNHKKRFH